jgi:hypothetical protein
MLFSSWFTLHPFTFVPMLSGQTPDPVRQHALAALTATFMTQGHPTEYAKHMATAAIFQTDLELRNAQLTCLLGWLKQEHSDIYPDALALLESTREEFERRVQIGG